MGACVLTAGVASQGMRFLLTNDDGIDAVGLGWLAELCGERGAVQVVAPEKEQSGVGHRVNTRKALSCTPVGEGRYALGGTPADCVRVGLCALELEADWVLSGINHGGNLGADLAMSGTVAGAREAVLLGKQGVAISQILNLAHPPNPPRIQQTTRRVLDLLLAQPLPPGQFYNVNMPFAPEGDEPEILFCDPDPSPLDVRYRHSDDGYVYAGRFLGRPKRPGHDVELAFGGKVTVSVVCVV